jgi:NAD(P)H dehydrogenase (quinone)
MRLFLLLLLLSTSSWAQMTLPSVPKPVGNYRPYKIAGKMIYINQIALVDGKILTPGKIGAEVSIDEAKLATQAATLNVLAVLKSAVGGNLANVKQAVQLTGFFNTTNNFTEHSKLMNESSDLLMKFLGDKGTHARAAIGAPSLPMDSPIEIQAIFEMM